MFQSLYFARYFSFIPLAGFGCVAERFSFSEALQRHLIKISVIFFSKIFIKAHFTIYKVLRNFLNRNYFSNFRFQFYFHLWKRWTLDVKRVKYDEGEKKFFFFNKYGLYIYSTIWKPKRGMHIAASENVNLRFVWLGVKWKRNSSRNNACEWNFSTNFAKFWVWNRYE